MRAKRFLTLLALLSMAGGTGCGADSVLPWMEDDYQQALAEARSRDVPLFVDVWAPW